MESCVQQLIQTSNGTVVNPIVNYIFAGLSGFSFLSITIVLFIMHWRNNEVLSTHTSIGVLFFAGLVTVVADMPLDNSTRFRNIFIVVLAVFFGTLVNVYGSYVFFQTPGNRQATLGFSTSSVSIIIFVITIPLLTMEVFAAISSVLAGESQFFWSEAAIILEYPLPGSEIV